MSKGNTKRPEFENPTQPDVVIEVGGKQFRLSFDFAALAAAKAMLRRDGIEINILHSLDFREIDVDKLPILFFAASLKHQPRLKYEEVAKLVNVRTATMIFVGLVAAYKSAMVDDLQDPTRAARRRRARRKSGSNSGASPVTTSV